MVKIKIRISGASIIAIPIYPTIPPPPSNKNLPRGRHGLPKSSAPRIRSAVGEIRNANFSTIFFTEYPDAKIINRIRTHLNTKCVGVIEYGIKNGWHLHIVHDLDIDIADRILKNYSDKRHHKKIDNINRTAWYMTKSCGDIPPCGDLPSHWYFCSRDLGREEIFYIDSTMVEVCSVGIWEEREYYFLTPNTFTTLAHLKKIPIWREPIPESLNN